MMSTMNPNQTLLQGKNQSVPDLTPAPLAGPSSSVSFLFEGVIPPSELYVNVDDQLIVSAATSQNGEIVTVNVRLLLPNGRIEDMQYQIRPANTRAVTKQSFGLAEGFLLSMSASAAVSVTRGQTFVRAALQRSASGTGQPAYVLLADYATTQSVPGYPNGRILSPTEGPGQIYIYTTGNPGAGNQWQISTPVNARWRIRAAGSTFTTSAAVANRFPGIEIIVGGNLPWTSFCLAAVVASTTQLVYAGGITPYTSGVTTVSMLGLPPDLLISGVTGFQMVIGSITQGMQAGDAYTAIALLVEEWLDNV